MVGRRGQLKFLEALKRRALARKSIICRASFEYIRSLERVTGGKSEEKQEAYIDASINISIPKLSMGTTITVGAL